MRNYKVFLIAVLFSHLMPAFMQGKSQGRFGGFSAMGSDTKAELTLRADGSASLTRETVQPRAEAERTVQKWDHYRARLEGSEEDLPALALAQDEPKPLSDQDLEKKLRTSMELSEETYGIDQGKLEKLDISKDQVKTVTSQTFANLEEMLTEGGMVWAQLGLQLENVRFEKDSDNHLKMTLSPYKVPKRYAAQMALALKTAKVKSELRIHFPGKIISSGLPETSGNTTGFLIDSAKPETLETSAKLSAEPIVIVTELAGLKIDQPLESKTLQQAAYRRRDRNVSNVPITEGGEGFTAEAIAVKTTTSYQFPEGAKRAEDSPYSRMEQDGTVVDTKVFGPKDRTIQSVTEVRVLKAVDDKGREVKTAQAPNGVADFSESYDFSGRGKKSANSKQIQCRFDLPEPDAKSIEEVTLQAVIQTVGTWKELTALLAHGKTNEIDLAVVLPGAKLTLKKVNIKENQVLVEGVIKGPVEIQELDVQIKPASNPENFQMQPDFGQMQQGRDKGTRRVTLRGYTMRRDGSPSPEMQLQIRLPTDTKRERVKFTLTGLDLF